MITAVEVEVALDRPPTEKEIEEIDKIFDDSQLEEGVNRWYIIATAQLKEHEEVPSEEHLESLLSSVFGTGPDWWLSEIWDLDDEDADRPTGSS